MKIKPTCGAVGENRPLIPDLDNPGQLIATQMDYYNRTRCFCRRLEGTPDSTTWDASYYHISYFSQSQDRRFELEWTCKANMSDLNKEWGDSDCAAHQHEEEWYRLGDFYYHGCADCGDKETLQWCYAAQFQYGVKDQSILWLKNDPRKAFIPAIGRPIFKKSWTQVIDYCDQICKEKVDPLTGCHHWLQSGNKPIIENSVDYVDNEWILKSRWHHDDDR